MNTCTEDADQRYPLDLTPLLVRSGQHSRHRMLAQAILQARFSRRWRTPYQPQVGERFRWEVHA